MLVFRMKEIAEICRQWQDSEFDGIIVFDGRRGLGKSTGAIKLAKAMKRKFTLKRDILFSREDVMHHLATRKSAILINDEAINTVYNRDFFAETQKKILKMLNMYRDSCNVVIWCVPNFYDLDKQFRSLVKMRIHVIRRGVAVIHSPNQSSYSTDNWDTVVNEKIERKWAEKKIFKPKYHRLTTFRGFLRYRKLNEHDAPIYDAVKQEKRIKIYEEEMGYTDKTQNSFELNLLEQIKKGNVTGEQLRQACILSNKKYTVVRTWIASRLRDEGYSGGLQALESQKKGLIQLKPKTYKLFQAP